MARNKLYYTKLGTFKCNEFEMSKDTFLKHLEDLIIKDNKNNYVYHFDHKDKYPYLIKYNNDFYPLYSGNSELNTNSSDKELLEALDRLCEISILFDREKDPNPKRKKVIDNAHKAVFHNDLDKKVYIDYIQEGYEKEYGNLIKKTLKEFKDGFFDKDDKLGAKYGIRSGLLWLVTGFLSAVTFILQIPLIPYIIFCIFAINTFDLLISASLYTSFKGVILGIINILGLPIRFLNNYIKKKNEKKLVDKTILRVKKHFYRKENNGEFDYGGEYEYLKRKEIVDTCGILIDDSEKLKNKILSIKDEVIRKEISKEMIGLTSKMMKDYVKVKEKEELVDFRNQYKHWLDGINSRVDIILDREKENENLNNRINTTIENIEETKRVLVKR